MTGTASASPHLLGRLRVANGKGVVRMEHRVDAAIGEVWPAGYGAGIQVHVEDLAAYLAGRERCDADARMAELFPAYADLAATVAGQPAATRNEMRTPPMT